jgi:homoserine dehydrogenase
MEQSHEFNLAILGCGTVGGATAMLLSREKDAIREKTGIDINVKYIVDVDFSHARSLGLDEKIFTKDLNTVLEDDNIGAAVELIGGTTIARDVTEKCLVAGKHVITANKALLAHYGRELMATARSNNVALAFEASCGGGIPIVRALYDGLMANSIEALYGIVNGTCNYILTAMTSKGQSYQEALQEAQAGGLAEADPTLDVSGMDSAHKLAILGSLAFGRKVDLDSIPVKGIDSLDLLDVAYGQELGYVAKLLAIARKQENGISCAVRPSFIGKDHPLAWISGSFNAASVYGNSVGHTMYYGRGAGGSPTASAVSADVISVALGTYPALFKNLTFWLDQSDPAEQLPPEKIRSRYYLRLMVEDKPGVFAKFASVLGENGISISSVLQKEPADEAAEPVVVPVVITTHEVMEGDLMKALEKINTFPEVREPAVCINIIDEHEENV